ncbi:MAG: LysM peptidoglycan-binding domain-containing protein [Phycisphaerales bacterium]|nr:LysM peptidoglycan-binding domain-containing protein [Phycisphaerales bacterium]
MADVYYGDRAYAKLLLRANPTISDPESLPVGVELRLPAVPQADNGPRLASAPKAPTPAADAASGSTVPAQTASAASQGAERTYVVCTGDSFYAIAQRELGSGARWQELFNLNRGVVDNDPKALRPGMKLQLPER